MDKLNVIIVVNHLYINLNLREKMFEERKSVEEVEEGNKLSPKFDNAGLIPVVTTDVEVVCC